MSNIPTLKSQLSDLRHLVVRGVSLLLLAAVACGMPTLSGTVVDETGAAVPDSTAALLAGESVGLHLSRKTDARGNFSFGTVKMGVVPCSIRFEKSGYVTQTVPCPVNDQALRIVLRRSAPAPSVMSR